MASVSTYLNFERETEAAFKFYKSVFGGEFNGPGIARMGDVPPQPGMPLMSEEDKKLVMHVELTILGGHKLMGTDAPGFREGVIYYHDQKRVRGVLLWNTWGQVDNARELIAKPKVDIAALKGTLPR